MFIDELCRLTFEFNKDFFFFFNYFRCKIFWIFASFWVKSISKNFDISVRFQNYLFSISIYFTLWAQTNRKHLLIKLQTLKKLSTYHSNAHLITHLIDKLIINYRKWHSKYKERVAFFVFYRIYFLFIKPNMCFVKHQ